MATGFAGALKLRTAKRQADKAKSGSTVSGRFVSRAEPTSLQKYFTLVIETPREKKPKKEDPFRKRRERAYSSILENRTPLSAADVERLVVEFRHAITKAPIRGGELFKILEAAPRGRLKPVSLVPTPSSVDEVTPESDTESLAVDLVTKGTKWLNSTAVNAKAMAAQAGAAVVRSNPYARASRWATEGKIFGLKMNGETRYPAYAFQPNGQPVPAMAKVLKQMEGMSPFAIAAWFESTSSTLGGSRPRELLATNGQAVIEAAAALREGPSHG